MRSCAARTSPRARSPRSRKPSGGPGRRAAGTRPFRSGRALFLRTPDGLGRSELAAQLARAGVQADGTARNWATVTRLMAMLDSGA